MCQLVSVFLSAYAHMFVSLSLSDVLLCTLASGAHPHLTLLLLLLLRRQSTFWIGSSPTVAAPAPPAATHLANGGNQAPVAALPCPGAAAAAARICPDNPSGAENPSGAALDPKSTSPRANSLQPKLDHIRYSYPDIAVGFAGFMAISLLTMKEQCSPSAVEPARPVASVGEEWT